MSRHPKIKVEKIERKYITLPWQYRASLIDVKMGRATEKGEVLESGTVEIPMDKIYDLSEQDTWDSQFGSAFIDLSPHQGMALVQAGYAVQETRDGYHRTEKLINWLESEGLI